MMLLKREIRQVTRCPPLRRIRLAGDDHDAVGMAGRERRFQRECRHRRLLCRRFHVVHWAERRLGPCEARCSGAWRHSTSRLPCSHCSLRDCTRGTAPWPGFSSARRSCPGFMASRSARTIRGASPDFAHWPETSAKGKGSPRCAGHCTSKIDLWHDVTARSRIACRATAEVTGSGFWSRL